MRFVNLLLLMACATTAQALTMSGARPIKNVAKAHGMYLDRWSAKDIHDVNRFSC